MIIHRQLEALDIKGGTAVALGYFDGVHTGHRRVLGAAVERAKQLGISSAAFTFSLPKTGGFKGRRILASEEKHRRVEDLGIQHYVIPPFETFCNLSPYEFVHDVLADHFCAKEVFCGDNFTFGKDKAGNVAVLKQLCGDEGIRVNLVPMAQYNGDTVSSTRIRQALADGAIEDVNAMLGEDYCIRFEVRHGKGLGRTLGFPTINQVYPEGMQVPKSGVYITEAILENGKKYAGATGLGTRPTVSGSGAVTCETFMPAFKGDIYGDFVTVRFCKYIKPTMKFDTLEELTQYVNEAAQAALEYFNEN